MMGEAFYSETGNEIQRLRDKIKKVEAENAVLVEALQKIASYNTLNGDKYNSYEWGWHGVAEFAGKALANTSEQAKALLTILKAVRNPLNHVSDEIYPHESEGPDEYCELCSVLKAYDKLKG